MGAKRSSSKKGLLKRFMISYIAILFIPLVITGLVYYENVNIVKKDALEANLDMLEQTKYIIDRGLRETEVFTMQLAIDSKLNVLGSRKGPLAANEVYLIYEALEQLRSLTVTNDFINKFYILFPELKTVLSQKNSYPLSYFYNGIYKYGDKDLEQWENEVLAKYHTKHILPALATLEGPGNPAITYLQSITSSFPGTNRGIIMVLVDLDEIKKPMGHINTKGGGNVHILDENGQVLFSKEPTGGADLPGDIIPGQSRGIREQKVNGKSFLYSYTSSSFNNWTYVAVLPSDTVLSKVKYVRNVALAAIALCILLGITAAYFLSCRNAKPVRDIASLVAARINGVAGTASDEYSFIHSAISQMIESDDSLRQTLEDNIPLTQAVFVRRLINGDFSSEEEVSSNLQQARMALRGKCFSILIVSINGYDGLLTKDALKELNALREIVKKTFKDNSIDSTPVDMDESTLAFVIQYPFDTEKECKALLQEKVDKIYEFLKGSCDINVSFAAGNPYESLTDMYFSFNEAKSALEYVKENNSHRISWYGQIQEEKWIYYYPVEVETRLISMAKAGNAKELSKLIDILYAENFKKQKISVDMIHHLYNEMIGTIYKIVSQIPSLNNSAYYDIHQMLKKIKYIGSPEDAFEYMHEIYGSICHSIEGNKRSHNLKLKEDILRFIEKSYMQQEMGLHYVASQFGVSEVYVSNFFKEQVGENFSDYIEQIRIKTACDLLLKGDMTLEEIAVKTGYNSANTLRRAFKRQKGLTPRDIRRLGAEG